MNILHVIMAFGSTSHVEKLFERFKGVINVNATGSMSFWTREDNPKRVILEGTPLHFGAAKNNELAISSLIHYAGNEIDANARGTITIEDSKIEDETPLHLAARLSAPAAIRSIFQQSHEEGLMLKANALNDQKLAPLHVACQAKSPEAEVVRILLFYGYYRYEKININQNGYENATPLHIAAYADNSDAIAKLFQFGGKELEVNSVTNFDETPLHFATRFSQQATLRTLLDYAGDRIMLSLTDQYGETPLHNIVRAYRSVGVARLLVQHMYRYENAYDIRHVCNIKNTNGRTPLEMAIDYKEDALVQYLLTIPEVEIRDTAIEIADKQNLQLATQLRVVRALREIWQSLSVLERAVQI